MQTVYKLNIYSTGKSYIQSFYNFGYGSFTKTMNNDYGQSEITITLPKNFDLKLGYYCDFIMVLNTKEQLLYRGKVISLEKQSSNIQVENVKINLLGALSDWNNCVITSTTTGKVVNFDRNTSIASHLDFVFEQAEAKTGSGYTLDASGLPTTNFDLNYGNKTALSALRMIMEALGSNYYFYVKKDVFYIRSIVSRGGHYLTAGKEVVDYKLETDITKVINKIYAWNGLYNYTYPITDGVGWKIEARQLFVEDTASVTKYGERSIYRVFETGTKSSHLASAANRLLQKVKNEGEIIEIVVLSDAFYKNGYPIYNFEVGDTFTLLNQDQIIGSKIIVSIKYEFDRVVIVSDDLVDYTNRQLAIALDTGNTSLYKGDQAPITYA